MNDVENAANATAKAAKSAIEAYQAKLIDIAKENMQFAFDFGQALTEVRLPADFMEVTAAFSKKRFEMFQRHTQELMALSKSQM